MTEPTSPGELVGPVESVRDGDTFTIVSTDIRLCGVDAPERNEPGWREAADAVRAITTGKAVRCVQVGDGTVCDGRSKPASYDRIVAQCFVGDLDIATYLAEAGLACDWIKFSGGHYSAGGKAATCP